MALPQSDLELLFYFGVHFVSRGFVTSTSLPWYVLLLPVFVCFPLVFNHTFAPLVIIPCLYLVLCIPCLVVLCDFTCAVWIVLCVSHSFLWILLCTSAFWISCVDFPPSPFVLDISP